MANPIGISYPIRRGTNGYFEQSFDTKQTMRDALANLILTPRNTRPGRPEYGSSLYEFLFEQITEDSVIEDILREDIRKWLPAIEIISIKNKEAEFFNSVNLSIVYKLKNTPLREELNLTVSF